MMKIFFYLIMIIVLEANECSYTVSSIKKLKDFIKNTKCKDIVISFKNKNYVLRTPLLFNKFNNIRISGAGIGVTNLIIENKKGGLYFFFNKRNNIIELNDFSIHSKENNISYGVFFKQPYGGNQHKRNLILKDIYIDNLNNSKKFFFKKAINIEGAWRPLIQNVFVTGFLGPRLKTNFSMDICFNLKNVYSPAILNCRCWSSKIGLNFVSNQNPGPEGIYIAFSKFVNTFIGINIKLSSNEPEGFIIHNHINSLKYGIKVINKKFLVIKDNLLYMNKYSKKYVYIFLKKVYNSIINSNIFYYPSKKINNNYQDFILQNSSNNIIKNNLCFRKIKIINNFNNINFIKFNYLFKGN